MPEIRNIIFLGISYAGLGSSHYFLKHVYPNLPNDPDITYKAILVDPSAKWYQRHASPRALVSADLIPANKLFLEIEPGYKQYGDKFDFIQGKATAWNEKSRTLTIARADGREDVISYWALVLGTGSKSSSSLFSLQGTSHTEVSSAHHSIHERISSATDIVIAGGGPTAVETAGEIGEFLNGAAGYCSSRPSNLKSNVALITNSSKLLPQLRQALSEQAEKYLDRVGVNVRYNTKVYSSETFPDGKTMITLHDGEVLEADIYIPAMGVQPM